MTTLLSELLWRVAVRFERPLRRARAYLLAGLVAISRGLRTLPGSSRSIGPPRHWTFDTPGWAGPRLREIDAPLVTDRAPVNAAGQTIPHQFSDSVRWPMPPTFVLELPDARLWGPDAVVITADDTVLADQTNEFGLPADALPVLRRLRLGTPRRLRGSTATVAGAYADSYYHWMFDLLPRVGLLRAADVTYDWLVAPTATRFQRETLELAGVPAPKIVEPRGDTYLELERLVLPSLPGTPGQSPSRTVDYLRHLLTDAIDGRTQHRRLFLSRGDTARRKPVNEHEVIASLAPLGFESLTMSGRSVREQAALFAEAEVVVAPHGGALTNTVFCAPGTLVLELFPPGYAPVCFWTISAELNLDYHAVFEPHARPESSPAQWTPYRIDPARVLSLLRERGVA